MPNFTVDICLDDATQANRWLFGIGGYHHVSHVEVERCSDAELFNHWLAMPLEMRAGDVLFHSITTPHGSRVNESDTSRRIVYLHYMARVVLEVLHPEWVSSKAGFSEAGFAAVTSMIAESGAAAGLEAQAIRFGRDGFESRGQPSTPRFYWQTLIAQLPAETLKAKRRLLSPGSQPAGPFGAETPPTKMRKRS